MGRYILFLAFFISTISASLFDFNKISNYKELYNSGNYKEALRELKSLKKDTPEINYNIANILYRLEKYKDSLRYYKRAYGGGVDEADRIYNIGNCYFKLKEWDKAIFSYNIALKIRDDKDIVDNLKLAYKMKYKPKKSKKGKKKRKPGKGKKDKNQDNKKSSSKKSTKKSRKLSKEELKKLKELEKKRAFRKDLKKMLNSALKDKKAPVLMYKVEGVKSGKDSNSNKPW